jgi:hypothetical protein
MGPPLVGVFLEPELGLDMKEEERVSSASSKGHNVLRGVVAMAAAGFLAVPTVSAQEAAAPSVDVTGFVDAYYGYNFNKPAGGQNGLRVFDLEDNAFHVALAEIAFEKKPSAESPVGFRADLNFGPAADISNAFEPSNTEVFKHLQQGYVSWLASPKLQLDFGKFVTPIGNELVESKDNWNYTRSIQFGYAIPIYHAGLRATLTASDKFTVSGFLVNGWNNVAENNDDKTFAAQIIAKPSSKLTWVGAAMVGNETGETRTLFDTILTLALSDKLSVAGNFDYGSDDSANWMALSAYARLQASDKVAFSPRFEYLDDEDAFMTLTSQTLTTYTLTTEVKLGGGILARLDLRRDQSDIAFFEDEDGGLDKGQNTLTLGVVYAFGGKI